MDRKRDLTRIAAILALVLLAALLLPMLLLGRYAVPAADDYTYGAAARHAVRGGGSFFAALAASAESARVTYFGWQGTFSAVFLMGLQPAVFADALYALTPAIMLGALLLGLFSLNLTLYSGVFGMTRGGAVLVSTALCFLCTQLLPSPVQGFFWYNGSVFYTFFFGIWLTGCALCIAYVRRGGTARLAALLLMALLLGGGNYITALSCAVVCATALVLTAVFKTPGRRRLLLPSAVFFAAFLLSVLAPGNANRELAILWNATPGPGAVRSILLSFQAGARYAVSWASLPLLGVLLCLAPVMWEAVKRCGFSFRFPLLVSVYSYCLFSAMFCPTIYASSSVGDQRTLNAVYYAYVWLTAGNLFYWLGWLSKRVELRRRLPEALPLLLGALALLLCCALHLSSGGKFTSAGALGVMRSGEAQAFRACADRRLPLLEDESLRDVALEPFPSQPWLLFFDDVNEETYYWVNEAMCLYYDKDSITVAH